jgi:small subunit ribosomal protein S27Ae
MNQHYVVKDGRLLRSNPFCPRCGAGVFMADKGDWWSCGKCGDRYNKKTFKASYVPLKAEGDADNQSSLT